MRIQFRVKVRKHIKKIRRRDNFKQEKYKYNRWNVGKKVTNPWGVLPSKWHTLQMWNVLINQSTGSFKSYITYLWTKNFFPQKTEWAQNQCKKPQNEQRLWNNFRVWTPEKYKDETKFPYNSKGNSWEFQQKEYVIVSIINRSILSSDQLPCMHTMHHCFWSLRLHAMPIYTCITHLSLSLSRRETHTNLWATTETRNWIKMK